MAHGETVSTGGLDRLAQYGRQRFNRVQPRTERLPVLEHPEPLQHSVSKRRPLSFPIDRPGRAGNENGQLSLRPCAVVDFQVERRKRVRFVRTIFRLDGETDPAHPQLLEGDAPLRLPVLRQDRAILSQDFVEPAEQRHPGELCRETGKHGVKARPVPAVRRTPDELLHIVTQVRLQIQPGTAGEIDARYVMNT